MENIELQGRLRGGKGLNAPTYLLGSHLVSALVYDLPTSMRSISHEDLERWDVTYCEAMEAALENLEAASVAYSHIGDGFHTALSGDSYDSSRILLIDRIRQMPVTGATVAMVPQRDALYITGSDDETGLRILLDLTEQTLKEQPRPLAPLPLQLVDDAWEDWTVPKDHPLAARFQRLQLQYLAEVYAEQAGLLEALHEQEGQAAYVAQFSGLENEQTGQLHSYCVWTQGVDTLLPRARHVVFVAGDEVVAQGPWERVQNVAGDLLEPRDDLYPIRYRVREFPTAD